MSAVRDHTTETYRVRKNMSAVRDHATNPVRQEQVESRLLLPIKFLRLICGL